MGLLCFLPHSKDMSLWDRLSYTVVQQQKTDAWELLVERASIKGGFHYGEKVQGHCKSETTDTKSQNSWRCFTRSTESGLCWRLQMLLVGV